MAQDMLYYRQEVRTMKTKVKCGITFNYLFRKWWVVNWDDTDELWICQDGYRNIRFFSTEKIQEILLENS